MRFVCSVGVILAALCLSPGCDQNARKPSTAQPLVPTVGYAAPEIDGVDLDGVDFKLSDYKGKVVMLDFWATWCPPCMKFLPHGKELVEKYKDRPFVALGVNTDKDVSLPKNCKDLAMRCWADGFGGGGPICTRWGISGFPTVYVIDQEGIIRHKYLGPPDRLELDRAVERMVKKAESKS